MGRFSKIKRNEGSSVPSRLVFLDCEAYIKENPENKNRQTQSFRLACAIAGRFRENKLTSQMRGEFHEASGIWRWIDVLTEPRTATWIFAHNLSYDATLAAMWDEIRAGRYCFAHWGFGPAGPPKREEGEAPKVPQIVLGDPPTIIGLLNRQRHKIVLVDSLNYLRCPLRDIGISVGLEKLPLPQQDAAEHEWLRYCWRDVEILAAGIINLIQWWEANDYGNWAFTAPSLAMHAFRHRFMKHDIRPHTEPDVRILERAGYYGGRLEAYRVGEINGPCYLIDINSLYPAVMKTDEYPTTLWTWDLKTEFSETLPSFPLHQCVAECVIRTDSPDYPVRTKRGVIYPVGEFVTTLCGPELFHAQQSGHLAAISSWAYYQTAPIFFEYVEHFWAFKRECELRKDHSTRDLAKLMLNSLSGKFSQRGSTWIYDPNATPLYEYGEFIEGDAQKKEFRYCLSLYDLIFVRQEPQELASSMPIISAFITSAARMLMRALMDVAGRENVLYITTDALIVDRFGFANLEDANYIDGDRLGHFKLSASGMNGHIGGIHQYRVGHRTCWGGVPDGVTPDRFGRWEHTEFEGLRQIIARGASPEVRVSNQMKALRAAYERRRVGKEGDTQPWQWDQLPASFERQSFRDILTNARKSVSLICQIEDH